MWSDFDIELERCKPGYHTHENGYSGDVVRNIDIDAINNSLRNILSTLQGSRRMLPSFANGLNRIIFEQMDERTDQLIRNQIISAINKWDSRITVKGVHIDKMEDSNTYNIRLLYFLNNKYLSNKEQEFTYILRRIS